MRNITYLLILSAVIGLSSCMTTGGSWSSQGAYANSLYYTPDPNAEQAALEQKRQASELRDQTNQSINEIYVGDNNQVDIDYRIDPYNSSVTTYSILDDSESYEARLRKFDSPTYTINLNIYDDSYWYRPNWAGYSGWYNPWWGTYWRYPWYYDDYYWGFGFGTRSWYLGWGGWCPGYYDPWYPGWGYCWDYGWGHGPGWGHGWWHGHSPRDHRSVYYGRRNGGGIMHNAGDGRRPSNSNTRRDPYTYGHSSSSPVYMNGNSNYGRNNGGSIYRRPTNNGQNSVVNGNNNSGNRRNNSVVNSNSSQQRQNNNNSNYRRNSNNSGTATRSNSNSNSNSSYRRGNNTSNYTYSNSSSNSSESSYSSGSKSNGGEGSNYRRR